MFPLEIWLMIAERGNSYVRYTLSCCSRELYGLLQPLRRNHGSLHPLIQLKAEPILSPELLKLFWDDFPFDQLKSKGRKNPFGSLGNPIYTSLDMPMETPSDWKFCRRFITTHRLFFKTDRVQICVGANPVYQQDLDLPLAGSEYFDVMIRDSPYCYEQRYNLILHLDRGNRDKLEEMGKTRFLTTSATWPIIHDPTPVRYPWESCTQIDKDYCCVEALKSAVFHMLQKLSNNPKISYVIRPDLNVIHIVVSLDKLKSEL